MNTTTDFVSAGVVDPQRALDHIQAHLDHHVVTVSYGMVCSTCNMVLATDDCFGEDHVALDSVADATEALLAGDDTMAMPAVGDEWEDVSDGSG